jgi:hypothetical protein
VTVADESLEIRLDPVALFAKRDGASDYGWQAGRERLLPGVVRLVEALGQHAASTQAQIALLWRGEEESSWLARSFARVVDAAGRLSPAVEVLQLAGTDRHSPEVWLRLLSEALGWKALEHTEPFTCAPRPIEVEPRRLGGDEELRARLGLALSLTPLQALDLVRRPRWPWRYRGICYSWSLGGGCIPRLPELRPFVCVNFDAPPADTEEQALLHAMGRHAPVAEEWQLFDQLAVGEVRRALDWIAAGAPPPAPVRQGDLLAPWVVAWLRRRDGAGGPALLDAVAESAAGEPPATAALQAAAPELSAGALDTLAGVLAGEAPALGPEAAEELARGGYLGSEVGGRLGLDLWAAYAATSEAVANAAVQRLVRLDVPPAAAGFLLDLPALHADGAPVELPEPRAAELAARIGLAAPRRALAAALASVEAPASLERLAEVARAFHGWGEGFAQGLATGRPGPGLSGDDLLQVVTARQRVLKDTTAWRTVLAGLVHRDEVEAARDLFARLARQPSLAPPAELAAVLAARLGAGPPAPAPLASTLEPLAREGLARPDDIVIAPEDGRQVPHWAALWPTTARLAHLYEGHGAGALPAVPAGWRAAVRGGLAPSRLARWLAASPELPRAEIDAWAAEVLELPRGRLEALLDGDRGGADADTAGRARDWLAALAGGRPRPEALRLLAAQVRLGLFQGDENGAGELVDQLLPQESEPGRELAVHALCRVGPLPQLDGVSPDLAQASIYGLDPVDLVDAAFRMTGTELTTRPDWVEGVATLVERSGAACAPRGYLKRQLRRHAALAVRLAQLPGWERLALDRPLRERLALRLLKLLGVRPEDLVSPRRFRAVGLERAKPAVTRRRS